MARYKNIANTNYLFLLAFFADLYSVIWKGGQDALNSGLSPLMSEEHKTMSLAKSFDMNMVVIMRTGLISQKCLLKSVALINTKHSLTTNRSIFLR